MDFPEKQRRRKKRKNDDGKKVGIHRNAENCLNLYFILIFPFSYWGKVLFLGNFSNHISSRECVYCVVRSGSTMDIFFRFVLFFSLSHFFLLSFIARQIFFFRLFLLFNTLLYALIWTCVYIQKYFFLLNKIHKISVYLKDLVFNLCNVTGAFGMV